MENTYSLSNTLKSPLVKLTFGISFIVSLILQSNQIVQAEANSLVRAATLYTNGHPITGEQGRIVSVAASEDGLLFVSFSELSDPEGNTLQELDVWNIVDPTNPQLINRVNFQDPGNRGMPDDPSFLAPHDLKVIGNYLIFWRNFELYSYLISDDGSLTLTFQSDFSDDLNSGLNRLSYGGNYATSERQLLTNNEFLRLLDQLDYSTAEDLISENVLISLQDPAQPFLVKQNQILGRNYRIFDPAPNAALAGLPARIDISEDLSSLNLTYSEQSRDTYVSAFWAPVLRAVLGRRTLSRTLNQLSASIVANLGLPKLVRSINGVLTAGLDLPNRTLSEQFSASFEPQASLSSVLSSYNISVNDSIEIALKKIVSSLINAEIKAQLSSLIVDRIVEQWMRTLFGKLPRFVRTISTKVNSGFSSRVKDRGFDRYLVDVVMGPLIDLPPIFRTRLGSLINSVADSEAGQVLSGALTLFNTTIPAKGVLRAAGFKVPRCFNIPDNARNFLKLLLTTGGAKLNTRNYAFIEFLKLYAHYNGNNNFTRFIRDASRELAALHSSLSQEFSMILLKSVDPQVALGDRIAVIVERSRQSIDIEPIVVEAIVENISERLTADGLDTSSSVRSVLESFGLYVEADRLPAGASLATNARFSAVLSAMGIGSVQIEVLVQVSGQAGVGARAQGTTVLDTGIRRIVDSLWQRAFGEISLTSNLEAALGKLIVQQLSPITVGQYVESLIGDALANLSNGVPIPSLIETVQRASQGDCLAQYQVALLGISATPIVGQIAIAAEAALVEAQSIGLEFVTEQLLNTFLSQIFSSAAQDYPSWNLNITQASLQIPRNQLSARNVRFVDPFVLGNKVAVLLRDLSAGGWIPGYSRALELAVADSSNVASTVSSISLGDWDSVQSVISNPQGFVAVYGQRLNDREFPGPAISIVDVLSEGNPIFELQGDEAEVLGGFGEFATLTSNRVFIASTENGTVTIFSSDPR